MVPALRDAFNSAFTKEKYQAFLDDLHSHYPGAIDFRISETAEYIPAWFGKKITDACESIIDIITDPKFREMTANAIPPGDVVAN